MIIRFLIPLLLFIPVAVLQLAIIPFITVQNISPNLVVVLLVFFTLKNGQVYGTLLGFVFGFLLDITSGGLIGAFMISFTIAGFIAGYFYNYNKFDITTSSFVLTVIVFLCGTISLFLYSIIANRNIEVRIMYQVIEDGILPGVYTALFSIPIVILNPKKGIE